MKVEKKLERHTLAKIKAMIFVALCARFAATLKRRPKMRRGRRKIIRDLMDKLMP